MQIKKYSLILLCILFTCGLLFIFSGHFFVKNVSGTEDNLSSLETSPQNASYVVMGSASIKVPRGAVVVTQVDRVIKDSSSNVKLDVSPDHQPASPDEVVPYMEGARVKELMKYADVKVIPATNVTVKYINGTWYGPDDQGNYIYGIDPSKITPRMVKYVDNNTRIILETHGMNVMVPDAIKNHAFLVVACGDLPGKAEAEAYMNSKAINCYAPSDRYTSLLMNRNSSGISLGSEPIRPLKDGSGAIIGGQPIAVNLKEKIIVQTIDINGPDRYYDTPERYFKNMEKAYGVNLDLDLVTVTNQSQTYLVVNEAHKTGANVIAVRVMTEQDKRPVEQWLNENTNHRAILFHSADYDPGYSLFSEFPYQVTGQDPQPVFIKQVPESKLQNILNQYRNLWQNQTR